MLIKHEKIEILCNLLVRFVYSCKCNIYLLVLLEGMMRDFKREDEIRTPLYDLELETGVIISPMFVLRKDWENRPFRTPFYINVVNEGIKHDLYESYAHQCFSGFR